MFKVIEFLRSKPSDRNIRIIRIIFALILLGVIYFGFPKTSFNYESIPREFLYGLYIFPIIGILRGIFDWGIMRKKFWKWTQIGIGTTLIIISWFLIETDIKDTSSPLEITQSGSLSVDSLLGESHPKGGSIDTDFWVGFLGFFLAIGGIFFASKNITTKNERYGEIIKKIRI